MPAINAQPTRTTPVVAVVPRGLETPNYLDPYYRQAQEYQAYYGVPAPGYQTTCTSACNGGDIVEQETPTCTAGCNGSTRTFFPIPLSYGSLHSSPDPGVVVGIVLGAVAGFLLLVFLIYACLGLPFYKRGRRRRHHRHRYHRPRVPTMSGGGGEEVVDEEDVVEEVVVIEEGERPKKKKDKKKKKKKKSSSSSESSPPRRREEGGFREVNPRQFAGGNAPVREVRQGRRGVGLFS